MIPATKEVQFDKDKLKRFKRAYNKAVKERKDSFIFDDNEYLTLYAKYLIEYLTDKLK